MTGSEPTAPAPPSAPTVETPWEGLHPASLVVNLIPQAWRTARGAWPLLVAMVVGGEGMGVNAIELLVLFAFFGMAFGRTAVHWATLRYRVHDGRFEIKSGLLHRQARSFDPTRIQNIELVRNLFHRASGLVELRLETAGENQTEGLLSALSVTQATRLRDILEAQVGRARPPEGVPPEDIAHAGIIELIAYGLSRRSVGVVAVLVALLAEAMDQLGPTTGQQIATRPGTLVALVLLAFAGSWALSAGASALRYYDYHLRKDGDRLVTEAGLFTRRRVEIPIAKVQLVRTDEPLLRRLMGYATVLIETAGLGITEGRVRQAEGVAPMIDQDALPQVVRSAIPTATADPWTSTLRPPHRRALWRAVIGRTLRSLVLTVVLVALAGPWGLLALLAIPLSLPFAWLDWRWQGWLVTPEVVIGRRGWFTRQSWVVSRDKLQSVHLVQGPLLRLIGLGRVVVRVAGTELHLPDLGFHRAQEVLSDLSPAAAAPPGRSPAHP